MSKSWQSLQAEASIMKPVLVLVLTSNKTRYAKQRKEAIQYLRAHQPAAPKLSVLSVIAHAMQGPGAVYDGGSNVLSVNTKDDYAHLTAKTLLAFKWCVRHMSFQVLIKIDEDTRFCPNAVPWPLLFTCSARMPLWKRLWTRCPTARHVYAGQFRPANMPVLQYGKWRDPGYLQFFGRTYPEYAYGGGYILSVDLVAAISGIARTIPVDDLRCEDATVGTLVDRVRRNGASVQYVNLNAITTSVDHVNVSHEIPCTRSDLVFQHKVWWTAEKAARQVAR